MKTSRECPGCEWFPHKKKRKTKKKGRYVAMEKEIDRCSQTKKKIDVLKMEKKPTFGGERQGEGRGKRGGTGRITLATMQGCVREK